jgi:hypothetical protein
MPTADANLYQCNPATLAKTHTTCLPLDMLERLREKWNTLYPKHTIPHTIRTKERLWAELRERIKQQYKCATEYCAISELGTTDQKAAAASYFRPKKPDSWTANPTEWHDSNTLAAVMEQYEAAYPHFEFIGPTPIDFDESLPGSFGRCVFDELCNLNLKTLMENGKTDIGIIFNLDPHDRSGSHWICAYIDIPKKSVYYYDSYGYKPNPQIRRLLRRCREQGCNNIIWNDFPHQRKNTECGTYCLYVIISLLKDIPFQQICKNRVDDATINSLRDLLFATERPSELALKKAIHLLMP